MRHLKLTVVMGVLAAPGALSQTALASRVSGTIAILEKHNKPSPDIGDAVNTARRVVDEVVPLLQLPSTELTHAAR